VGTRAGLDAVPTELSRPVVHRRWEPVQFVRTVYVCMLHESQIKQPSFLQ
jgi:hypothetical protein